MKCNAAWVVSWAIAGPRFLFVRFDWKEQIDWGEGFSPRANVRLSKMQPAACRCEERRFTKAEG